MKVHEIAKELDVASKDVLTFLNEKGIEAKAAQSALDEIAEKMVRNQFGKKEAPKKEAPKAEGQRNENAPAKEAKQPAPSNQEPVKKKKIIFVNNPHNSKMPGQPGPNNSRPQGQNAGRPQQGQNFNRDNSRSQNTNNGRPMGQSNGNRTIQGSQYSHNIIKPRAEAINRPIPEKYSAKEEPETVIETPTEVIAESVKTESAPVKPAAVRTIIEEAPKKEYLRRDNTQQNDKPRRDDRPQGNRQGNGQGQGNFNRDGGRPQGNRQGNGTGQGNFNRDGGRSQGNRQGGMQGRPSFQGQGGRAQGSQQSAFTAPNVATNKPDTNRRKDDKSKNKNFDPTKDGGKQQNRRNQERESGRSKNFMLEDDEETLAMKRKKGKFIKPDAKPQVEEETIKVITVEDTITIKDLADKMKIQPAQIVKKLFLLGQIVNVNQEISFEEAENIAIDYEIICERAVKVDVIEELLKENVEEEDKDLVPRPPVVCVMGHVDHGKTSLLDAIRKTKVTDREAGGITQAIGAYTVHVKDRDITFLDTPGHEAFTAMRMRGANSTDIAVLVVAADDGVMPQTVEAINHAKAAGVEVIVAVNKIDKPAANPDKVMQELTEYELIPTTWGGSTEFVNISAKRGDGIDELLETILLTADVMELKANPKRKARGLVIEAELDKGRGPVATVLVQKGTLKVGDFVSAGACHGKVRAMINDKGKNVKTAGPSIPVEILGLDDVPNAGEVFISHDSDKTAKSFADTFIAQNKEKKLEEIKARMSLDDLFNKIQEGNLKELNIIVKADVQGSVEAVKQSLMKLSNEEVVVKCIHGGVGAVNESDVTLASASNAIIVGFNVRPDAMAKATAEQEGVEIKLYKVIYQAIEDIENAMKGMLAPVYEEKIIGHAEIRQIFKASAIGNIAGSYVLDGMFQRGAKVRIKRGDEQIYEGSLASLKRFKDDVKEVKAGFECGLVFDGFDQFAELDVVEAYIMVEVPRK